MNGSIDAIDAVVLTGDVVRSRKLSPEALDAAMAAYRRGAEAAAAWSGRDARFQRFRGDGWQALGPDGRWALRAALRVRAEALSDKLADTRMGLGVGPVRLPASGDLATAEGAAPIASGAALDALKTRHGLGLSPDAPAAQRAAAPLCDALSQRWKPIQARCIALMIAPQAERRLTQDEAAERLDVSQQAVSKALDGAGWWAIEAALEALESSHAA
ncbi:MAG: hypothetical protein AAF192_04375 [Pseudomonadota bacterium]